MRHADLKLSDVRIGDVLVADAGFTCLKDGQRCEVKAARDGLYVECSDGRHYLSGQVDFKNSDILVGLTR